MEAVEHMTLGDIVGMIVFFAGAITAGTVITKFFTKRVEEIVEKQVKLITPSAEQLAIEMAKLAEQVKTVDINECKNYLQQTISAIEAGQEVDEVTKIRFDEVYDHYSNELHLNSWVHTHRDKLKKEGKL